MRPRRAGGDGRDRTTGAGASFAAFPLGGKHRSRSPRMPSSGSTVIVPEASEDSAALPGQNELRHLALGSCASRCCLVCPGAPRKMKRGARASGPTPGQGRCQRKACGGLDRAIDSLQGRSGGRQFQGRARGSLSRAESRAVLSGLDKQKGDGSGCCGAPARGALGAESGGDGSSLSACCLSTASSPPFLVRGTCEYPQNRFDHSLPPRDSPTPSSTRRPPPPPSVVMPESLVRVLAHTPFRGRGGGGGRGPPCWRRFSALCR